METSRQENQSQENPRKTSSATQLPNAFSCPQRVQSRCEESLETTPLLISAPIPRALPTRIPFLDLHIKTPVDATNCIRRHTPPDEVKKEQERPLNPIRFEIPSRVYRPQSLEPARTTLSSMKRSYENLLQGRTSSALPSTSTSIPFNNSANEVQTYKPSAKVSSLTEESNKLEMKPTKLYSLPDNNKIQTYESRLDPLSNPSYIPSSITSRSRLIFRLPNPSTVTYRTDRTLPESIVARCDYNSTQCIDFSNCSKKPWSESWQAPAGSLKVNRALTPAVICAKSPTKLDQDEQAPGISCHRLSAEVLATLTRTIQGMSHSSPDGLDTRLKALGSVARQISGCLAALLWVIVFIWVYRRMEFW